MRIKLKEIINLNLKELSIFFTERLFKLPYSEVKNAFEESLKVEIHGYKSTGFDLCLIIEDRVYTKIIIEIKTSNSILVKSINSEFRINHYNHVSSSLYGFKLYNPSYKELTIRKILEIRDKYYDWSSKERVEFDDKTKTLFFVLKKEYFQNIPDKNYRVSIESKTNNIHDQHPLMTFSDIHHKMIADKFIRKEEHESYSELFTFYNEIFDRYHLCDNNTKIIIEIKLE